MIYSVAPTEKAMNVLKEFLCAQVEFYTMKIDDEKLRNKLKEISSAFDEAVRGIVEVEERNYYLLLLFFLCRKLKSSLEKEHDSQKLIKSIYNYFERDLMDVRSDDIVSSKSSGSQCYSPPVVVYSNEYNHHGKKYKRSNFPKHISRILKDWLIENADSPYPTESEKQTLSDATGLDHTQINNWFINARRRILPILRNKK